MAMMAGMMVKTVIVAMIMVMMMVTPMIVMVIVNADCVDDGNDGDSDGDDNDTMTVMTHTYMDVTGATPCSKPSAYIHLFSSHNYAANEEL